MLLDHHATQMVPISDASVSDGVGSVRTRARAVAALVAARHPGPASRLLAERVALAPDTYWITEPATRELQMVCDTE